MRICMSFKCAFAIYGDTYLSVCSCRCVRPFMLMCPSVPAYGQVCRYGDAHLYLRRNPPMPSMLVWRYLPRNAFPPPGKPSRPCRHGICFCNDADSARTCSGSAPNRLCRPVSDIAAALPAAGQQPPMPLSGKIRNFATGLGVPSP